MRPTTFDSHQLTTIFGGGYIPEQHGEDAHFHLPPLEGGPLALNFDDLLKALRAALSLR